MLGFVDYDSMKKLLEKLSEMLQKDSKSPIYCIINSGGGGADPAFMFIDLVKVFRVNLVTIGTGGVGSMAIPMFCAGSRRFITPHTDFFFHEMGYGFSPNDKSQMPLSDLQLRSRGLEVSQEWYIKYISDRTKNRLSVKQIEEMMKAQTYLLPQQIVELGLAHKVI